MTATERRRLALTGLLAVAATVSMVSVFKVLSEHPEQIGIDLPSYTEGARRLAESGSPYSAELHAGPLENIMTNIGVGYLYPPPLAQLFLPLVNLPIPVLIWVWTLAQAILLVVLLPVVYRRFGGDASRTAVVAVLLAAVAFTPNLVALYIGNVSGWIAALIGLILITHAGGRATSAVAAMWLKLTPSAFAVGAVIDQTTRWKSIVASFAVLATSLLLAPAAWVDWLTVLPSIVALSEAPYTSNLAPTHVLASTGNSGIAVVTRIALPLFFGILLIASARKGNVAAWVAAATGVYLTASGTSWDHYFAALAPLAAAAWPDGARIRYIILGTILWFGPLRFLETQIWYQLIGLALWLTFVFWAVVQFSGGATVPGLGSRVARVSPAVGNSDRHSY